jgi:pantothenate kinase
VAGVLTVPVVRVSPGGDELRALADRLRAAPGRVLAGIAGAPGCGKSTVAAVVAALVGEDAAVVPLDGFHLADVTLDRLGLLTSKGVPESFDAWGYAALLERLRRRPTHTVYAPAFERDLEQPLAGAVAVPPGVGVVVTEGNYLLLDLPEWRAALASLDEVWFVETGEEVRRQRLVARHVAFGKEPAEARAWVERVDDANARLVAQSRESADLVLDLSAWSGQP